MIKSNTYIKYLRLGLNLRPVNGIDTENQEYAFSYHCDGVQYVLNDMGEYEDTFNDTDINEIINNLRDIANSSRHERVLAVQNYIEKVTGSPVWVEVGRDIQLSVVYGTKDGVIAQMIMDFSTPEKLEKYKEIVLQQLKRMNIPSESIPEFSVPDEFIVIPVEEKYDALFSGMNIPGVIVEFDESEFFFDDSDDDDDE